MSTPTRSPRKPTKRRVTLRLPSIKAFAKLPLDKRQVLFVRWVKSRPKTTETNVWDAESCPMALFAQALARSKLATAGAFAIYHKERSVPLCQHRDPIDRAIYDETPPSTLGKLATRLRRAKA